MKPGMISILTAGAASMVLTACVQSHRYPSVVYTPVPEQRTIITPAPTVVTPPPTVVTPAPTVVAPTSDSAAVRVYPDNTVATTPPATGVAASDLSLANSVSQLLKTDSTLSASTDKVEARVKDGIVTLRGSVPTQTDREVLVDRIARLPGVAKVKDQLSVELR
jgi:BON domain